ncbi:PREDICTED: pickpocket protein 11 [Rhagoletis zephyria]|uniref:pickpocket protein 11 n=1 Tax=Rhagoletis zephyria TaxID=28612 RepID=UPI0008113841|nr:PREDICTED: pickpocket protein 11 [Rhagoletis zephyria]
MSTFKRSPFNKQSNRIFDIHQHQIRRKKLVESPTAQPYNNRDTNAQHQHKVSRIRQLATFSPVRHWFLENLRNYCNSTSLHGFNYITLKGSTANERYFWIIIVIISIIVSIVLVIVSWNWNRATPTVTVIESAHFPTWNIPFPAVTICNFNKISKVKAMTLARTFKRPANVSEEKLLNLFRITMFFNFALNHTEEDFRLFENILTTNNYTITQLSNELTPDCLEMMSKCVWKGTRSRCESLFQPVQAMEGVCCSFNYYGRPTNNFPKKIAYQIPKRPYRVTGCGYATGISVVLNPIIKDYFGTYLSSYGFRMLIHDAYNFPDENAETKVVTSGRESFVRINPESTYATNDVRKMDIELRGCLFSDERKLWSMKRYSFINCMSECRTQILYDNCGCIPLSLANNGSFRTCDLREMDCVMKMRDIFSWALPTVNRTVSLVQNTHKFPCDCLPDCQFNGYPSEITMGLLDMNLLSAKNPVNKTVETDEQILLHVFFSDLMAKRYRMDIFQDWLSSLASFGGLLGLIMGFSIVTAFEFLYFLTFRPIFNYFNDS